MSVGEAGGGGGGGHDLIIFLINKKYTVFLTTCHVANVTHQFDSKPVYFMSQFRPMTNVGRGGETSL